jgi:hypothetical protein
MKIFTWSIVLVFLFSCSSSATNQKKSDDRYVSNLEAGIDELIHGRSVNLELAAAEFCECQDSEDPNKCYDAWVEKYEDTRASDEDSQKMGETMAECDLEGVLYVSRKIMEQ